MPAWLQQPPTADVQGARSSPEMSWVVKPWRCVCEQLVVVNYNVMFNGREQTNVQSTNILNSGNCALHCSTYKSELLSN